MFQFFKTSFSTKITNFTKFAVLEPKFTQNFHSKALNLAKIQFFKPYFFQKFSSLSPIFFPKNQFSKPLFLVPTRSLSPHLWPFGPHIYTKMKVEYPPDTTMRNGFVDHGTQIGGLRDFADHTRKYTRKTNAPTIFACRAAFYAFLSSRSDCGRCR